MLEPVRVEAVDEGADERRPGRSRQSFDEQIRGERREHERRQEHDVVGDDRMDARRPQRDSRERGQQHRVGERQRERLGVEDIAAEERPGIATPLLGRPNPSATSRTADRRSRAPRPSAASAAGAESRRRRGCRASRAPPETTIATWATSTRSAAGWKSRARHCCHCGRSTPNGLTPDANHQRMASAIAAGISARSAVARRQHGCRRSRCRSLRSRPSRTAPTASVRANQSRRMATRGRNGGRPISIACRACEGAPRHESPRRADSTSDRTSSTLGGVPADHADRHARRLALLVVAWTRRGALRRVARLVRLLLPGALRTAGATWRRPRACAGGPPALLGVRAASQRAGAGAAPRRRSAEIVPAELERSLYTWVASLLFLGVCTWWQPVPGVLYRAGRPVALRRLGCSAPRLRADAPRVATRSTCWILLAFASRHARRRVAHRRHSAQAPAAQHQRALRLRAPPAVFLVGTLRLRHPDHDRHARGLCRHQHRVPDDRDSVGRTGPLETFGHGIRGVPPQRSRTTDDSL